MPKEKIEFPTNVAVPVALAYTEGKKVEGRYGDQYYFTLTGDRCMYVPPVVAEQIQQLGIAKGQEFTITKAERKNGTRRFVEWIVDGSADAAEPPETGNTEAAPPKAQPKAPANGSNGAGRPGGVPPEKVEFDSALAEFLVVASEATRQAEKRAGAGGVRFDNRDVAALATTMFIQAAREGWLTWQPRTR